MAVNDSYAATEDTTLNTPVATGVLANDTGMGPFTATLVAQAGNGTVTLNTDGSFTYVPVADFAGSDSFTYTATGPGGASNTATVTLTVANTNDAPTATADSYATQRNVTLNITAPGVLANDVDVDTGDTLTAQLGVTTTNGVLTLNADGSFSYVPTAGYSGPDSFTYRAVDAANAQSALVTVTLDVVFNNMAPVAVDDAYTVAEDTTLVIPQATGVLANDTDPELSTLSAARISGPTPGGALTLNSNGSFSFTPPLHASGDFTFTYQASDGSLPSNTATVTITVTPVNDAPVAVNDGPYTVAEEGVLTVPVATGVLANDTDVENNVLSAVLDTAPTKGLLTLNPDGSFGYTPFANEVGADSFTYKADDGDESPPATVSITITNVNDAPVGVNDSYSVNEDVTLTVALVANGVLANDTDADGETLTAELVTSTSNGVLTLNTNGTFTYVPAADFNGSDSFTYRPRDALVPGNNATVSITVNAVNDPPVANDDAPIVVEDDFLDIAVMANDTDIDGVALTIQSFTQPANGTVTQQGNNLRYAGNANFFGPDSFTYTISDGAGGVDTGTVSVTVMGVNDAPVAFNDGPLTTEEGTPLTVAAPGVLGNDVDVDDVTLTATVVDNPTKGTLLLNSDGSFTYTPNINAVGTDSFTYRANDNPADSNLATVSLTIQPVELFQTTLTGSQEVPSNGSLASGTATCRLNTATNALSCTGTHNVASTTAAHIHAAAPGVNGGVVLALTLSPTTVTLAPTVITTPQANTLRSGGFYINIHSTTFPGGEIRGQLLRAGEKLFLSTVTALPALSGSFWYVQSVDTLSITCGGASIGSPNVLSPDSGLYGAASLAADIPFTVVSTGVDSYSYSCTGVTPVGFATGFTTRLYYDVGPLLAQGALVQVIP